MFIARIFVSLSSVSSCLWKVCVQDILISIGIFPRVTLWISLLLWNAAAATPYSRCVQTEAHWAEVNVKVDQTNTPACSQKLLPFYLKDIVAESELQSECTCLLMSCTQLHLHVSSSVCWQSVSVMSFPEHSCITCLLESHACWNTSWTCVSLHFSRVLVNASDIYEITQTDSLDPSTREQ